MDTQAIAGREENSRARKDKWRGFSIIEFAFYTAIVLILVMIAVPVYQSVRAQAQTAACESNMRTIATDAELFYTDYDAYPGGGTQIKVDPTNFNSYNGTATTTQYLTNTPQDPAATKSGDEYLFTAQTVNGQPGYVIQCPASAVHVNATLSKLSGYTSSSKQITYTSGAGLAAK